MKSLRWKINLLGVVALVSYAGQTILSYFLAPEMASYEGSLMTRQSSMLSNRNLFILLAIVLFVISFQAFSSPRRSTVGNGKRMDTRSTHVRPARGPLQVLRSNPRYFTDGSGKALLLVGSHTWNNFQDWGTSNPPPLFDYADYLRFMRERGHNFFRLWVWEQAAWVACPSDRVWFTPMPYVRTGPGIALDGEPKFDLNRFNSVYFQRLRDRIELAGQEGFYVSVMLFNGPSRGAWRGHPFNRENNINGIDGDPNGDGEGKELHSLQNPRITQLQKAYIRQVIDTVGDLDNVLWEISNESHGESQDWQYAMIQFIKNYEAPRTKQHPVGMTVEYPQGSNLELFASTADWISPNSTQSEPYSSEPPASDGKKVILSDTDHLWGIGGNQGWVWKSFLRGLNPIFMDPYDATLVELCPIYGTIQTEGGRRWSRSDPEWEQVRRSLGQVRSFAARIDLAQMVPRNDLASSGYCLANPGVEYLVYLPSDSSSGLSWFEKNFKGQARQSVQVNLSDTTREFNAEWFIPDRQESFMEGTIKGGGLHNFSSPIGGDAVLYLKIIE